jgi:signal transduction histidine kinase
VNELAHEIRNPLVTIKTISQHLERLLESASGREEVVQLAGEAVQKIDSVFENLLRYSRFREPKKEETTVNAIVAQVLSELAPLLSERRIVLNYRPPDPLPVFADREQLGFALVNLLEALVRDLEDQTTLTIEPVPGAPALRIEVPRVPGYLSQRLSALIEENVPAEAVEPLGLLIARSLFRRNGGRVQVQPNREGSRAAIIIEFPGSVGTRDNYGQAKSVDRG